MSRFRLLTNPEKCVGCRLCQMRCSFRFTKNFSFSESKVDVTWDEDRLRHDIIFDERCDACGLCVRSCVYGALDLEKRDMRGGAR